MPWVECRRGCQCPGWNSRTAALACCTAFPARGLPMPWVECRRGSAAVVCCTAFLAVSFRRGSVQIRRSAVLSIAWLSRVMESPTTDLPLFLGSVELCMQSKVVCIFLTSEVRSLTSPRSLVIRRYSSEKMVVRMGRTGLVLSGGTFQAHKGTTSDGKTPHANPAQHFRLDSTQTSQQHFRLDALGSSLAAGECSFYIFPYAASTGFDNSQCEGPHAVRTLATRQAKDREGPLAQQGGPVHCREDPCTAPADVPCAAPMGDPSRASRSSIPGIRQR